MYNVPLFDFEWKYCISFYTIRVKEGKGVGNQKNWNFPGLIVTRYDIGSIFKFVSNVT